MHSDNQSDNVSNNGRSVTTVSAISSRVNGHRKIN